MKSSVDWESVISRVGFVLQLLVACAMFVLMCPRAHAQTGPCETYTIAGSERLRCYIGPTVSPVARVYIWTTASTSPNANAPAPWSEIGENPYVSREVERVRVRLTTLNTGLPRELGLVIGDTGWIDMPMPTGKVFIGGQWIDDRWIRVTVYVVDVPGCAVVACGARLVMARTAKNMITPAPVVEVFDVREVAR